MSAEASGYAKALVVCPNGETITAREKLLVMCLADSHQVNAGRFTYPSVETLSAEALCDRRSCQRYLDALERKGVIRRLRPPSQGAGMMTLYFFPQLEAVPEGWQDAALFLKGRAAKGRQKGGRRAAAEQLALMECAREPEQEQKQEQIPPNPPGAAALGGAVGSDEESGGVNSTLERWMDEQGFTAKRLRRKLRAVHAGRMRVTGNAGDAIAAEMADAWKRYQAQGHRLFRHATAAEFFETGLWLNSNGWAWNMEFLNQEERTAEARAGTWG